MARVDWAKLDATTEEDIARYRAEDDAEAGLPPGAPDTIGDSWVEYPVEAIRGRLGLTQKEFARMFGVSVDTLQGWEQRRRRPRGPALALLRVIDREPDAVRRALRPREVA